MIIYVIVGVFVVLAVGVPVAFAGKLVARFQDKGKRCKFRRPHPAVVLARDLWSWLDTAQAPAPRVPSHPRWGPLTATPAAGIAVVRDDWVIWCGGRNLGTMPRRTPALGPFTQVDMPACPEPEPGPAFDPCDDIEPAPPVLGFARSLVYGEACEIDVAEAERQFALAMGPDGCEET